MLSAKKHNTPQISKFTHALDPIWLKPKGPRKPANAPPRAVNRTITPAQKITRLPEHGPPRRSRRRS